MSEAPEGDNRPESPEDRRAGTQMTLAAIVISAFGLLGKILGYGKEILIANYWGAGPAVDAFVIVYNDIVFQLYAKVEKLLRPTYLPIFVGHNAEGDDQRAWRFFGVVTTLVLIGTGALSMLAIIFAPQIMAVGWPNAEMPGLASDLLRISGAAGLLLVLSVMAELTLHSFKQFTIPALADASRQFVLFASIGGLIGFGLYPSGEPRGLHAAAIGVLLGGAARLVVQIPALLRRMKGFYPSVDLSNRDLRRMLGLIPPVIVGLMFSLARTYFDSRFSTDAGEGVRAALGFGRKLADLPTLILPLAVSLVVYPYVSEWASRKDRQRLADSLVSMTRAMAYLFVPLAVAMIMLAQPIVSTAFERGEFTADDTIMVSRALVPYSAGLPFYAVEASINKWYFALSDTATPNYIGAAMAVLHILIAGAGVHLLNRNVGVIAAALSISKGLKVIILYLLLRGRIGTIDRKSVGSFVVRLLVATGAMAAVVLAVANALSSLMVGGETLRGLLFLAACGGAGVVTYVAASVVLKIEELSMVVGYAREKLAARLGGR